MDDYTIVDLPLTNVAQAHFLGQVVGSSAVALVGEPVGGGAIRILGPRFAEETQSVDLV